LQADNAMIAANNYDNAMITSAVITSAVITSVW